MIRRSSFVKQPWVNGLGFTHEIAVHKIPDASTGDPPFLWRLSMADLATGSGAFSKIHGVNRCLTLLSGELELAIDSGEMTRLPLHVPFAFPCDVPTHSIVSRPGYDLNLMWSRERATGKVSIHCENERAVPLGVTDESDAASGALAFAVAVGGEASVSLVALAADDGAMEDEVVERVVLSKDDVMRVDLDPMWTARGLRVDSGRIALCELFVR